MSARVLVTGTSGFLGLHCAKQAIDHGFEVSGTLRNPDLGPLVQSALGRTGDPILLHPTELNHSRGWEDAVEGVDYVLHVASPFPVMQPKDASEVIDPAVNGTRRIIELAQKHHVKRVVITGSMNAVAGAPRRSSDYIYSEADWTDPSDPHLTPYDRSKTLAERAAWQLAEKGSDTEIVIIHPGAIFGPPLAPRISASGDLVRALLEGDAPALPRIGFAPVDVRDVAVAHMKALTAPGIAGKRFVCCVDQAWLHEVAQILADRYNRSGFNVPSKVLPDFLVRIGAFFSPALRRAAPHVGRTRKVDNGAIIKALGIEFRPVEDMIIDMADRLIELGLAKPSRPVS